MCEPISISTSTALAAASLAATVGGSIMQMQSQNKAQKAQQRANDEAAALNAAQRTRAETARRTELERQDKYRSEAEGLYDKAREKQTPEEQQALLDKLAQENEATYRNASDLTRDPNAVAMPVGMGDNQVIKDEATRRLAASARTARSKLAAQAVLDAFGGLNRTNQVGRVRTNQGLSMVQDLRAASARAGQQEQDMVAVDPRQVGPGSSLLGDVLVGAGQFGSYAAGSGFNPFGSSGGGRQVGVPRPSPAVTGPTTPLVRIR